MAQPFVYDPPWLVRLREVDPKGAELFEIDPTRTSELDIALAGIGNDQTKLAVVRSALNSGVDPNDVSFRMVILAVGMQKLVQADHEETLTAIRNAARGASEAADEIRTASVAGVRAIKEATEASVRAITTAATDAVEGIENGRASAVSAIQDASNRTATEIQRQGDRMLAAIETAGERTFANIQGQVAAIAGTTAALKRTADGLPDAIAGIVTRIEDHSKVTVAEHAKGVGRHKAEEEFKKGTDEAVGLMKEIVEMMRGMREALIPVRKATERLAKDGEVAIKGLKITGRERRMGGFGLAIGAVVAFFVTVTLANMNGFGLSPQTRTDIAAGRTYQFVYPSLPQNTRDWIETWLKRHY
jgi:hypothetical protein